MQVVKIDAISEVTAAFVMVGFSACIGETAEGQRVMGRCQVVLPTMNAPGVGELAVFLANREDRPAWMRSPLLCYHGAGLAMGRHNDGGLFPCAEFQPDDPMLPSRYALVYPRVTTDPQYQEYVQEGQDVTEFYLGGVWAVAET